MTLVTLLYLDLLVLRLQESTENTWVLLLQYIRVVSLVWYYRWVSDEIWFTFLGRHICCLLLEILISAVTHTVSHVSFIQRKINVFHHNAKKMFSDYGLICGLYVHSYIFLLSSPVIVLRSFLQTRQDPSQQSLQTWLQSFPQGQVVGFIEPQKHRLYRHSSIRK